MTSGPGRGVLLLELLRLQLARASATRRWGMPIDDTHALSF